MEGKEIPIEKNFFDAGTSVVVYDESGNPETFKFFDHVDAGHAHANCRCTIRPGKFID